ncbi:MAG TPA: aminomethyl-transferring glycine dehydrogenase subunit GcvPB [Candidatus Nanoarchaeia archaeon]|nr:aminomethyl-transferring glycine dehydrogenase subunit GcvPB [Candidatus Nanoarchaeia archaeon]
MKLLFEKSIPGRKGVSLPLMDVPVQQDLMPKTLLRKSNQLPELSEIDIVRHFTELSRRNFGVDNGFYPLGSCTMKYNPKINEETARMEGFASLHPYNPNNKGALELMYELGEDLKKIAGMDAITLQPAAGAHGELTGLMLVKAYFKDIGQDRSIILTPDSSHGTNPASSAMCGFETITIKSDLKGQVDISDLKNNLNERVAAVMLTIPNTLGIFEHSILEITKLIHDNESIIYMDGANLNALVGKVRPGDMGVDVMHINLHKTFSTPHGGGGPGAGPVAVKKFLEPYLPNPGVGKDSLIAYPKSIGRVRAFYGNFGMLVRAYTYIKSLGSDGLLRVSENAVLNANYMKERLRKHYDLPYDSICKHEFVLSDKNMPNGITTNNIAKRLLDYGFHPPTIYFPLIVHGAIMIEPTETEGKEVLDSFIEVMVKIKDEAASDPEMVRTAPHTTVVKKLDAVLAARKPCLKHCF